MDFDIVNIVQISPVLGLMIFLYLKLRQEFKEEREKMSIERERYLSSLDKKAGEQSDLNKKLLEIVETNTTALTEIKGSVDNNTEVVKNIDFILRFRNGNIIGQPKDQQHNT